MSSLKLGLSRILAGRWEGTLTRETGDSAPDIEVVHLEKPLPGLTVGPLPSGGWAVACPIPADLLSDGVQTFLIRDRASGTTLGHFTIVTGVPFEDDLRAEIDLIRAELDMLKRAFRRHCVETGAD